MLRGLRSQLTSAIVLIVLITIALASLLSNIFVNIEFENYAKEQREIRTDYIVQNINAQYSGVTKSWDVNYIHGVGMYALSEGYILSVYDSDGNAVWDAENHNMEKCGQIMAEISDIMEKKRPLLSGGFTSKDYALKQSGRDIGKATIIYYGPYFFSESEFRFLDTLNLIMAIIGAIALLGSIIAGAFLARRISRPIVKTVKITEQIADGNFGIRFEGSTKTRELAALTEAVNHMAQSLDKQENLRRQLTTDVAHELRTPLSALSTHLEMMTEGVWEATRERLQNCYEEIERITALVADLEKLSQIEDGNLRLQISETDLKEIAEAVAENFASESARKNIMLTVEGENVKTQADEGRIKQVITNLISNAIKYTPEGGEVKITTKIKSAKNPGEPAGKIAVLTVEDDGIGIDPEDLPHIFERFYRTDKSRNRKTGGAGIGLTIAKSIITAHKGTIKAESKNGAGARFVVELGVGE